MSLLIEKWVYNGFAVRIQYIGMSFKGEASCTRKWLRDML